MAFLAEDGTGLAAANSLATVAEVSAYFSDRGETSWDSIATQAEQEQALVRATDYFEKRFGADLAGCIETPGTQALSFPRTNLYMDGVLVEGVPTKIKYAIAEYALLEAGGTSMFLTPANTSGRQTSGEKIVVGPIEINNDFVAGAEESVYKQFPDADFYVLPFLEGGGNSYSNPRVIRG